MLLYVKDQFEIQTVSGKIVKSDPCLLVGPHTERINSRLGKYNLMVYVGFKSGALYKSCLAFDEAAYQLCIQWLGLFRQ
jgi:hypothetical protein